MNRDCMDGQIDTSDYDDQYRPTDDTLVNISVLIYTVILCMKLYSTVLNLNQTSGRTGFGGPLRG